MPNPFRNISKEELLKREADKKLIADKIKVVAEIGNKLLASPDGIKYKQELEKQRDEIIKLAIRTVDPDPIKDSFFTRACLNKLSVLYGLLESITKDANARR